MKKTWAAPDIEFDRDGRRIRPEEPAGTCKTCNGVGMVSLGDGVRGIGRCPALCRQAGAR